MGGLDYGNARLRAMRSRLLAAADYDSLVGTDSMDGLVSALTATAYATDIDAALPRFAGLRRFDEIVRQHLTRVLGPLPSYYENPRDGVVGLLTDRWDLHNLRTLFRVKSRFEATDEMLRLMVPIGRLGAAELNELAVQPSLRYVIDLMVAWRIPSRQTAQAVRDAWPAYESSGDLTVLETALGRAFANRVDEQLDGDDSEAAAVLRGELDEINVLTCLRLRAARQAGENTRLDTLGIDHYLPGGRIRLALLADIAATDDRSTAASLLQRLPLVPGWSPALHDWAASGDLVALATALRLAATRHAVGLFGRGDPLGYDIPVAFTRAQEHEARNLRWIGRGIVHGFRRPEVEHDLAVVT
jgi:V/A-type H+-transporting ATPase subunit C